ncbi:MAG: glutamate racemase [Treponema sp.]|nr:glutamate racemase [Treponema sp.]
MNGFIDFAFLDSGTGGIPYMLALKEKRPEARCVYLGDTEHFPYGQKTRDEVVECASKAIDLIVRKWNPRSLVIACNTISVTALDGLRAKFPRLPIIGTVPAIRLAAKLSKNRKIGLLATNATVSNPYNERLVKDFASDCQVFNRGDPELIDFIERNLFSATKEERLAAVKPAIDFFREKGCDTIILGCTHFTHIASDMKEAAGEEVIVVDSREGVVNQAIKVESATPIENHIQEMELPEDCTFFCTGYKNQKDEDEYRTLCSNFNIPWGGVVTVE